ncbi:MAG TPA: tetratricopeptide repeat protein [Balneolaceae bacterium]
MVNKQARQELERDPLLETFSRTQSFYDNNKAAVIGGFIALIVIIGGAVGYYYYSSTQENEAQRLMAHATQDYMRGNYQEALTGSKADFTVGFQQIIANYSGTDAANLARYYAAVAEYNLGNFEQALEYIKEFEVPEGIMGVGPISFHGVLLTAMGNHAQAADIFVKAAEWDQNDSTTPYNYLEAANAFYDAGNQAAAQEYAERVINNYSSSPQVAEAQRLLGMLAAAE